MLTTRKITAMLRAFGFVKADIDRVVAYEQAHDADGDDQRQVFNGNWAPWLDAVGDCLREDDFRDLYSVESGDFDKLAAVSQVYYLLR